jgi:hypothetical protein
LIQQSSIVPEQSAILICTRKLLGFNWHFQAPEGLSTLHLFTCPLITSSHNQTPA